MADSRRMTPIRSFDLEAAQAAARAMEHWDAIDEQATSEGQAIKRAIQHRSQFEAGSGARSGTMNKDQALYDERLVEKYCSCRFCDARMLIELAMQSNGLCFSCFLAQRATAKISDLEALRLFA